MEVAYQPRGEYPTRPRIRKTQSTAAEADRILNWNYNVATSNPPTITTAPPPAPAPAHRRPSVEVPRHTPSIHRGDDPYPPQRRTVPRTSSVYEPTTTPRQNSSGISTGTVVGTLLGVAAGAAFTYSVTRSDRDRPPHEFEPPTFARRSTFPDPYPEPRGRYVDIERNLERVRHPGEYPPCVDRRPPPEYIARYSQAGVPRSKELDDAYHDTRSRHSTRSRPSTRARSEAVATRKPLLLAESEHRSYAGSRHGNSPPISRSVIHRADTYELPLPDRSSHASSRSHRSAGTMRAAPRLPSPPPAPSQPQVVARSRAGSRVATTTVKVGNNQPPPRARSRGHSYVSARNANMPPSVIGSTWGDDADSVAPSDSISCVGSRRTGRSHR